MSERWLTSQEALETVRAHVGGSVGFAQRVLNDARKSGEVRFHNVALPVLIMADDGVVGMHRRPGAQDKRGVDVDGKLAVHRIAPEVHHDISHDDLLDWLNRKRPTTPAIMPQQRSRAKQARVNEATRALWPAGVPAPALLPNGPLCTQIADWLKDDCKRRGVPPNVPNDKTILRSVGRAK